MAKSASSKKTNQLLIAVYAVFALAATARASYQLATKFSQAPVSYTLSAISAVVYIVATVALIRGLTSLAKATIWFELVGVVVVGTLSLVLPVDFQHSTVWSLFGAGYGCIPLILPIWGLWWLGKNRRG